MSLTDPSASQCAILDNWSLQIVGEILDSGLSEETATELIVDRACDSHHYAAMPSAAIAIEALFDLVADIVLRDQLWVDERFVGAWQSDQGPLNRLVEEKLVVPFRFLGQPQELNASRDVFVNRMSLTKSLREEHAENVEGWAKEGRTPHQYLSQLLWGGAGMLARAYVYDQPYTPHPMRRRLFARSGITLATEDSTLQVKNLVADKQAAMQTQQVKNDQIVSLKVRLPAFASAVICESKSPSDFIRVALQLRSEYSDLRKWLGQYHLALKAPSHDDARKYQDILRSVSKYADAKLGKADANAPTFTAGVDFLKMAARVDPVNTLKNQFGVQSLINKIVFSEGRSRDLKALLDLFGQRTSKVGLEVMEHFARPNSE